MFNNRVTVYAVCTMIWKNSRVWFPNMIVLRKGYSCYCVFICLFTSELFISCMQREAQHGIPSCIEMWEYVFILNVNEIMWIEWQYGLRTEVEVDVPFSSLEARINKDNCGTQLNYDVRQAIFQNLTRILH